MAEDNSPEDPILYQDMSAYWQKHYCPNPNCNAKNWTYHSHSQRHYTGLGINTGICRCHSCKIRYWIGLSEDQVREAYGHTQNDPDFPPAESYVDEDDGRPEPN